MTKLEKGPEGPEQEPNKEEAEEKENVESKDEIASDPERAGERDREELDKFMEKTESEALLQILEGRDPEALLKTVNRHDEEFAPQKMDEIEEDAKEYVEKMPDNLREIINDPDVFHQLAESFQGEEEQDVRHKLELMIKGVEEDSKFRQWVEDQYCISRIRSFIAPQETKEKEEEFNEEERKKIQERISEEAKKIIEEDDILSFSGEVYDPSQGEIPKKRMEEILTAIESGKKIESFEDVNDDFQRVYEKMREKSEKEERMENPYREIERRLISAQERLEEEGFQDDAENLNKVIERLKKETAEGEYPVNHEILLWDKTSDSSLSRESSQLGKLAEKIDSWMLKIPLISRYMSKDYKEAVRSAGGTIIRADGKREKFHTFTCFRKQEEKERDDGYHYITEPQPGDEVVSWEPSEKSKDIIMESLGGVNIPFPDKDASSLGKTDIKYKTGQFSANNAEFKVRRGEDLDTNQFYSTASLFVFPPPEKRAEN